MNHHSSDRYFSSYACLTSRFAISSLSFHRTFCRNLLWYDTGWTNLSCFWRTKISSHTKAVHVLQWHPERSAWLKNCGGEQSCPLQRSFDNWCGGGQEQLGSLLNKLFYRAIRLPTEQVGMTTFAPWKKLVEGYPGDLDSGRRLTPYAEYYSMGRLISLWPVC